MRAQTSRLFFASAIVLLAAAGCNDENGLTTGSMALSCSASPVSGVAPLQVGFTAQPSGAPGPFTIAINFGDGTTASDTSVGHTYTSPGAYTARFTAVGAGGASAECTTTVTVLAPPPAPAGPTGNQPPEAVFKTNPVAASGTITGRAPLTVQFNMCPTADPDHDLLLFTMDFEFDSVVDVRGTTGSDCRRSFTYPLGTTQARICVTDVDGGLGALHPPQCQIYSIVGTP